MGESLFAPAIQPALLTRLREDLELRAATSPDAGGAAWLIYDALRHKYHSIDHETFSVLSLWKSCTTVEALQQAVEHRTGLSLPKLEIDRLSSFLEANQLTENGPSAGWRQQSAAVKKQRQSLVMRLIHNYLFFKVPLFAPERFLRATLPFAAMFYARAVQAFILMLGLAGLYLVSREWDTFLFEARDLATLGGAMSIAAVLFFVKALHELGHAYTAYRYGCRVPSIGIAFMMMAPMLYTDVTDSWRLKNRKQRLAIDCAGVSVELGLACLATVLWVFLPDGTPRHVAFLIATTSWVMSLAINLNPFMRFDGYYILSDVLRIENLQARAFALGLWRLREWLFDLKEPCPEAVPPGLRTVMIAYAYGTWIYRLVLFTGIALLVYAYFFKVLGILLFLFEIGYFILRPVILELSKWWSMRQTIRTRRRFFLTAGVVFSGATLAVLPLSVTIQVPAVLEGKDLTRVFPPRAARVISIQVSAGKLVKKGELLVQLDAPSVRHDMEISKAKLDAIELRLGRQSADSEDRTANQILEGERATIKMQVEGLVAQLSELEIRSPADGRIAEFNQGLRINQWISAKDQIALVDSSNAPKAMGYVSEENLWRLEMGQTGRFTPDVPLGTSVDVVLTEVAATGAASIEIPELSSISGGQIEVHADARQKLIPASAQYLVTMDAKDATPRPDMAFRGTVQLKAKPESFLAGALRRIAKILVRESGI